MIQIWYKRIFVSENIWISHSDLCYISQPRWQQCASVEWGGRLSKLGGRLSKQTKIQAEAKTNRGWWVGSLSAQCAFLRMRNYAKRQSFIDYKSTSYIYQTPRILLLLLHDQKNRCYGVIPCYRVSLHYGVSLCYSVILCYSVSLHYCVSYCYSVIPCYGVNL